jgi:tetratricopeptide (TPR) repeat protein|tara:strand:- start:79 stop:1371 length:1293 start_codon:yes stop_codon:yes gene_type:complete
MSKIKTDVTCSICKENDWTDLDYLRTKKENFVICNCCGFVTYLVDNKYLIDMYKNHKHNKSRSFSGSNDDRTKLNKLSYHRRMLNDILREKKNLSILDFGCSTGYVLNMCREEFGHKDVTGIELNGSHASYGRGEFGLDIHEVATMDELAKKTDNKKYDLIICFAVLEHLLDPVEKMKGFKKYLKPDGKMYVMVPLWFDGLLDSEKRVGHFENLFVPHHINCFSRRHIDNTFKLAGFRSEKYVNTMYGHMFILKQDESIDIKDIRKDDPKKIIEEISRTKKALEFMRARKFNESLEAYEINPEIWVAKALTEYKKNFKAQLECFNKALEIDPSHTEAVIHLGDLYMKSNDYENSIKWHLKAIEMSPNCFISYFTIAEIYNIQGKYQESIEWCKKLIAVNPQRKDVPFHEKGHAPRDLIGLNYANIWANEN